MRGALLAIVLMAISVPAQAASPSLSEFGAGKRAKRQRRIFNPRRSTAPASRVS